MARQRYDIASKWLLHHEGKNVLLVGGLRGATRIEPMPGEIAQNRRYPDGLLRVFLQGQPDPHFVLAEIATFPERRARQQALDDLALAYSALGQLPDLLILVLRPKGKLQIGGAHEVHGKLGFSSLQARWKTIELWTLPAEQYLAEGDAGIVPWVPLMEFAGEVDELLARCAEKIEREALPQEQENLLAVSQVMTSLRFPDPGLLSVFRGEQAMIESPLLQEWQAKSAHGMILAVLKDRFKSVPRDITRPLRAIIDQRKLARLNVLAAKCRDLDAFREALPKSGKQ